jgi:hypothetical protein
MAGPPQVVPAEAVATSGGTRWTRWTAPRRLRLVTGAVLVALLAVMLATVLDYGMTADEPVQNRYGNRLVRWYATLGEDRSAVEQHDTWLYGGFFELCAQAAEAVSPLDVYETRHVVNTLFGFLGLLAVWWLGEGLGGPPAGLLAVVLLALTPEFYGHAFANPKDIPFASLFALGAAAALHASRRLPRPGVAAILGTGAAIGLTAGVRVAGIVLFAFTATLWLGRLWLEGRGPREGPTRPDRAMTKDGSAASGSVAGVILALVAVVLVGWAVMVAFWPYAQLDPIRNPFRAFKAFTRFWEGMTVFYDGALLPSGRVSRFSIPKLFALTLPETYLVAAIAGVLALLAARRAGGPLRARLARLFPALCVAALVVLPIAWAVVLHTPFYNGNRHLLFIVPPLAALAGAAVAACLQGDVPRAAKVTMAGLLATAATVTASDMVRLHPYQAVYFNRLVAGGLAKASTRYETDYWCMTYKEGLEWIVAHYSRPGLTERVRVAGHSVLTQVSYELRKTPQRRRHFRAVTVHDRPHLIVATTATGDDKRTPGRRVHVIERLGAPLLYVFEVIPPR